MLQALLTSLNGPQPSHGLQGGSHGAGPREDPIETSLIEALSSLQARSKFHEIVSTPNEYNQTLAHLSVLYNYPSLLSRLVEWHIDLTIADVNGLTALHCAYMKGDLDCVEILRRGGASEIVTDILGRTPSELQPEGLERSDSDIDHEAEVAGLDAGVYPEAGDIDEQLTIGKQFSALHLDNSIDGQPEYASEDEKEPDSRIADSPAGGHEGGHEGDNGGIAVGSGSLASDSGGAQITSSSKGPVINNMNHLELHKAIFASSHVLLREKWLVDIKAWEGLFQERWYLNQELEPLNHLGRSILCQWLNNSKIERREGWSCCVPLEEDVWCTQANLSLDRALAHVRGHLGLKPFPCEGMCGSQYWYAEKSLPHEWCANTITSAARFSSTEHRRVHYSGPSCRPCEWWYA